MSEVTAVIKKCKYFYDLDDVMRERTCAIPEDIVDSTTGDVPDLNNPPSQGTDGPLDPLLDTIQDDRLERLSTPEEDGTVWNCSS
ncbi:hypothetical protein PGT21_036972 [Puccinia graminis f. sp. tritici]|uniref:Uncharacterized protein n=1 Tax=Puccinia graminis f. sp. tritici TaxID=56615 RepID=A0A5B0QQD1_PUCGR|nr:hypothetical protein PGT21_036972 [Puccinia graminis f. sp. tritici]